MVRIIRWTMRAIRFIAPWLIRFLGWLITLALTTLVSLLSGIIPSVRIIADDWVDRAVVAGFPTEYDSILFYTFAFVAFSFLMVGWVILSFATVGAIFWIF